MTDQSNDGKQQKKENAFFQNYRQIHLAPGMPLFDFDWNDMHDIFREQFRCLLRWLIAEDGFLEGALGEKKEATIEINRGVLLLHPGILVMKGEMIYIPKTSLNLTQLGEMINSLQNEDFKANEEYNFLLKVKITEKDSCYENVPESWKDKVKSRLQYHPEFQVQHLFSIPKSLQAEDNSFPLKIFELRCNNPREGNWGSLKLPQTANNINATLPIKAKRRS